MNLLYRLKFDDLNHILQDTMHGLTFNRQQANRKNIAHFCEHDGICICFTRARTSWHALAPCALRPWRLFLEPLRKKHSSTTE